MSFCTDRIVAILNEIRPGVDWENESDMIQSGSLDSFDMIALIGDLNESFGVSIGLEQMEPENFASVEAIEAMLRDLGAAI